MLFMVRYFDVLGREYARLRAAMRVRCFRPAMNGHSYRMFGYLVGMLLVRSFDRSERVLAAMKCRGFAALLHARPLCLRASTRRAVLRGDILAGGDPAGSGVDMNEPLVEFRDVDFAYGPGRPVLSGCNFCSAPGERVALLGPNGCGKTTLLHLIGACCDPRRADRSLRPPARGGGRFLRSPPPRRPLVPGCRRPIVLPYRGRGRCLRPAESRQVPR